MRSHLHLLLLAMTGLVVAFALLPVSVIAPEERTIRITVRQFAYFPSELSVNPGDSITIELVSTDVVHGLFIDGYDVSVEAEPGKTAIITFTADKAGSFRFRCSVTCGAMHPFMIGKLTVGRNEWLFRSAGVAVVAVLGVLMLVKRI